MASIISQGSSSGSGSVTLIPPNTNSNQTLTLPDNTGTAVTTGSTNVVTPAMQTQPLTSGTAVATTSGTSIDFTGIPSWVKRVTVMFNGVSTNGNSLFRVRIGTTAAVETTGYVGASGSPASVATFSDGFDIASNWAASTTQQGVFTLVLQNASTNTWAASWAIGNAVNPGVGIGGGSKPLAAVLERVRLTTVNGTDTFDAGSVNIMYE